MYIKTFLQSHYPFDESNLEEISTLFKKIVLNEGDYLLKKGEVSQDIFLIESGIVREYSILEADEDNDEEEQTYWILSENELIYQVESYVTGSPSKYYLQALTKVKTYSITKEQLNYLLEKMPFLNKVVIGLYEKYLLQLEKRNYLHKIKKAEKRLEVFEQSNTEILNRVKLRHIASFLNISSSEFSRIRARRAKKN